VSEVHVVLPNDIDDPSSPSGGNAYDRQVCRGLAALGWLVHEHAVRGAWPQPTASDRAGLARALATIPDDAVVLIDGLVASTVPDILAPEAGRLGLVVLLHMPLGDEAPQRRREEGEALSAAVAVVTTSGWSRRRVLDLYRLPADRLHTATPGVDAAALAPGSGTGSELLCVAAVTYHKGHDVLVQALASVGELDWNCVCVGTLDRDPDFVDRLRRRARLYGIADRVHLLGICTGDELDAAYAAADLFVLATRGETYGMVVTEALARGTPVLATAVKGLPEALGTAPDGTLPGMLVPAEDPVALAGALRRWLGETGFRQRLTASARARRTSLTGWSGTSELVSRVLKEVSAR
jgi:glycosyltransferase involved in cell wall biosynthesis